MSNKELIINPNPRIRTYTYHCFFHAVISGDDKVSEIPAVLWVKDYTKYSWREQTEQLTSSNEGDLVTFYASPWNIAMNKSIYRECQDQDEIEIRVDKQLYSNAWGAVNLFVAKETQTDLLKDEEFVCRFGNFCKEGVYLYIQNHEKYNRMRREEGPFSLILKKSGMHYEFLYKREEEEQLIFTWDDKQENEKKWIGFEVKLNNSDFYEWYYSHYINIYGDIFSDSIRMDYLANPMKSWYTYETNHFTQYRTIEREKIACFGQSILQYVKSCIDAGYYVEMWLNEGFIEREGDKPGPIHIHQNLVYGYSDDKQQLLVLHTFYGKPTLVRLQYEEFESSDNYCKRYNLIVPTAYIPEYMAYEITSEYLLYSLKNYYQSQNLEMSMRHCSIYYKKQWGIEMLRQLMTERGLEIVLSDIRISHLLYERAGCMQERIAYLAARKILTEEEVRQLEPTISRAYQVAAKIRNIVLKQRFIENSAYKERVKEKLEELYLLEMCYLPEFIQILERKIEKL